MTFSEYRTLDVSRDMESTSYVESARSSSLCHPQWSVDLSEQTALYCRMGNNTRSPSTVAEILRQQRHLQLGLIVSSSHTWGIVLGLSCGVADICFCCRTPSSATPNGRANSGLMWIERVGGRENLTRCG